MTPKTVVAFGETLWDLLPAGPMLGGAPTNFAYRINALGDRGIIVTRLGRDELGRRAHEALRALGMDTSFVQWDDRRPTGTVPVTVDASGNPDFTILKDVAYDFIEADGALLDLAAKVDLVCFGTLIQRSAVSRETLARFLEAAEGALCLLDINLRKECYTRETIESSLERADILKLNEHEAVALGGLWGLPVDPLPLLAESLVRRASLSHCLVTLGERGALAVTARGEKLYVPGYRVDLVDTCGSGDAFTAGFVHALLEGRPLGECLRLGNTLGSLVAERAGATAPVRVEELIDRGRIVDGSLREFACE